MLPEGILPQAVAVVLIALLTIAISYTTVFLSSFRRPKWPGTAYTLKTHAPVTS